MQNIQSLISTLIKSLYDIDFSPEISPAPKRELGEYCVNIFPIVKNVGKPPNQISEEVATELAKNTEIFRSTSATGGYVNFFLTDTIWLDLFSVIARNEAIQDSGNQSAGFLHSQEGQKTIIVDYIGANVGKPLHIGHICTPSIGQVICNVYRHIGYRVIGDSHFGDWGGIFGKLIYQLRYEIRTQGENFVPRYITSRLSNSEYLEFQEEYSNIALEEKYRFLEVKFIETCTVEDLLELYQCFHMIAGGTEEEIKIKNESSEQGAREEFKKITECDKDNIELWKRFTSISIAETEKKLELLNVHATYNIGESFYEGLGLPRPNGEDYPDLEWNMKDIVAELIAKGIATQNDDGSVGVVFPEEMKLPSCILQKKDGTGLYLTSDLAAIRYRLTNDWNPEKIIYSVDVRQQLHLRQAFAIAKMAWGAELGADNVEFTHAHNGFIKLKEGAMSTRHGTVIFLQALIDEGNERTGKILEEKGRVEDKALKSEDIQAITVGAIKYSYLAQDREKDVTFDWDKALNFEGNSGPYIQYAYVRARKITSGLETRDSRLEFPTNYELGITNYDKSLIQTLARFEEVVETVAKTYKPHHLALYAYDLAVEFNSFYVHTPKILEETDEILKNLRLELVSKSAKTLEKSFELLGIKMPSEM